jgi:hypothetical protein
MSPLERGVADRGCFGRYFENDLRIEGRSSNGACACVKVGFQRDSEIYEGSTIAA